MSIPEDKKGVITHKNVRFGQYRCKLCNDLFYCNKFPGFCPYCGSSTKYPKGRATMDRSGGVKIVRDLPVEPTWQQRVSDKVVGRQVDHI